MGRTILWLGVWLLSLGMLDIDVKYSDGLRIQLVGWPSKLADRGKPK
ncbi:hypothetical protein LCGC14_1670420 [marine sediment metagenome]|uniref:Uncharacterized protein n=1 Tax=marine sediment metagenome TaxID=412755 RepID=A0A0F9HRG5_9ZZZZ